MLNSFRRALQRLRPLSALAACALLASAALPAHAAPSCRVADARYTLKSDRNFTADFIPVTLAAGSTNEARIALHVRSGASGQEFWLGIEHGNGYSYPQLYPIENPALHGGRVVARAHKPSETGDEGLISMPLLVATRGLELRAEEPASAGDNAPELFAAPYLGMNYWYLPQLLSNAFRESGREMMPLGFFELTGCGK